MSMYHALLSSHIQHNTPRYHYSSLHSVIFEVIPFQPKYRFARTMVHNPLSLLSDLYYFVVILFQLKYRIARTMVLRPALRLCDLLGVNTSAARLEGVCTHHSHLKTSPLSIPYPAQCKCNTRTCYLLHSSFKPVCHIASVTHAPTCNFSRYLSTLLPGNSVRSLFRSVIIQN